MRYLSNSVHSKGDEPSKNSDEQESKIKEKLQDNLDRLKIMLGDSNNLKMHPFRFGTNNSFSGALVFIDDLVDNPTLTNAILRPVMS
ncbi:hypothetical protein [Desulfotomaculum sp. 1211_IL3151]|uniref:hypothetical protein n=1 Tax=Desulfotomaculum sp. 1211_IL3151 TaxID=3084055 RepID=UPI002FDA12B4